MKLDLDTMEGCMMIGTSAYHGNLKFGSNNGEEVRSIIEEAEVGKTISEMDLRHSPYQKRAITTS